MSFIKKQDQKKCMVYALYYNIFYFFNNMYTNQCEIIKRIS